MERNGAKLMTVGLTCALSNTRGTADHYERDEGEALSVRIETSKRFRRSHFFMSRLSTARNRVFHGRQHIDAKKLTERLRVSLFFFLIEEIQTQAHRHGDHHHSAL
jgi:hypothetical protein